MYENLQEVRPPASRPDSVHGIAASRRNQPCSAHHRGHTGNFSRIESYGFAIGGPAVASFATGAADDRGRGVEVVGNTVYYSSVSGDGIHLAPYNNGLGGATFATFPNPRPGHGIQDLDYALDATGTPTLYVLTGYMTGPPIVYALNPNTGAITGPPGGVPIHGPHPATQIQADGFTVLPCGDFLINDGDTSTTYRSYDPVTGNPSGLVITVPSAGETTGVDYSPVDNSLYFWGRFCFGCVGSFATELVQTDLSGALLAHVPIGFGAAAIEDISVISCAFPPPSMSAWWTFDEPTGHANDSAGAVNNFGVRSGQILPKTEAGMVDNAFCFHPKLTTTPPSGGWVTVNTDPEVNFSGTCTGSGGAESFTIDAWILADSGGPSLQILLDKRENVNHPQGYSVYLSNGRLGFQIADGNGGAFCAPGAACQNYTSPSPDLRDGQWHFIAVTVARCVGTGPNTNVIVFYVDGAVVATFPDPRTGSLQNVEPLQIGRRALLFSSTDGPGFYVGCMDELEIYKRVLTPAVIQRIYVAGSAGKCLICRRPPRLCVGFPNCAE